MGHITEDALYCVVNSVSTVFLSKINLEERLVGTPTKEVLCLDVGITKYIFFVKCQPYWAKNLNSFYQRARVSACALRMLCYTGEKMLCCSMQAAGNVMALPKMIFSRHLNNMLVVDSLISGSYTEFSQLKNLRMGTYTGQRLGLILFQRAYTKHR